MGGTDRGKSLYVRKKEHAEATLQDFIPQKVIGKGSFGKVFLVQNKHSKEVYAMKALRKDVILDYDQLQSTILEKFHLQKAQLNRLREEAERRSLLEARVIALENQPGQVQLEVGRIEEEVRRQSTSVTSQTAAGFLQLRGNRDGYSSHWQRRAGVSAARSDSLRQGRGCYRAAQRRSRTGPLCSMLGRHRPKR